MKKFNLQKGLLSGDFALSMLLNGVDKKEELSKENISNNNNPAPILMPLEEILKQYNGEIPEKSEEIVSHISSGDSILSALLDEYDKKEELSTKSTNSDNNHNPAPILMPLEEILKQYNGEIPKKSEEIVSHISSGDSILSTLLNENDKKEETQRREKGMRKLRLQRGLISGVLTLTMLFSGCSKTNEEDNISSNIYDDLSSSSENNNGEEINTNVTINLDKVPDSLTAEIEEVELENGEIGWKLPYDYVPYNVIEGKGLGFYAIVEQNLENDYIIIQPPMSLQDGEYVMPSLEGEIGVHMGFIKALSLKNAILNKYGNSMENTLVDYTFASPEEQEELAKIDALEEKVIETYNINRGISLTK